jgi:methylated-DNA-[protein]-cysteine S-methyltransferase
VQWAVLDTPVGDVAVAVDADGVCGVHFGRPSGPVRGPEAADGLLSAALTQLRDYFAGVRQSFELPLSIPAGTAFERAVWAELATIPYAEMRTYGQVATAVGEPGAARAVGIACGHNPLAIVLPCHRVVGADGTLVGFGGGLHRKRQLLELEARVRIEHDFG